MNISEYRKQLLAAVESAEPDLDEGTRAILDLAGNARELRNQIKLISDDKRSAEEKAAAIDRLNAASVFSPVLRTKMPELVNALRGQLSSQDEPVRHRAFGTLAAMKDEVAQERLVAEIESEESEQEKLVPTAVAIAMLGQDEKALPTPLLLRVAAAPPDEVSRIEAIRHLPADKESLATLEAIMLEDRHPLEARAMASAKISHADPSAFLETAETLLETKGADHDLAPFVVQELSEIADQVEPSRLEKTKRMIEGMLDASPEQFKSSADELLAEPDDI